MKLNFFRFCPFVLMLGTTTFALAQPFSNSLQSETSMLSTEAIKSPPIKYDYETVPGDPIGVKIYTLKNGLKLLMSVNKDEPRIMTNIAVRAGSKFDPAETTGLAHYLEHMMFKGSNKIGALNWDKEKEKLQKISDLYEQYRAEKDADKRKAIYKQIDEVSNDAAKLVAANEYDKLVSSMGAKGTNAYTWVEQTVYVNDIPSNELERWMQLESERFKMVVLRLFHTELEAVYEEFNINQDRDFRKVYKVMGESLFPSHPYGTQTTIGRGEDLKNPSHVNIQNYFKKYYVPNNMAIVMAGDFDPDQVVALAEKYWGSYEHKDIAPVKFPPQPEPASIIRKEVLGQESPWVQIGWRFNGAATEDPTMLSLISGILYNRQAGLIDIDLVQKQTVLEASTWNWFYEDYSAFGLTGKPREGQTLEDVEKLLMAEIEKIKKGEFEDWLIDAVIKDNKLGLIKGFETNNNRVGAMTSAFILGESWERYIHQIDRMQKITKKDVVDYANKFLNDHYAVVYKRNGQDTTVIKVDKPAITPVTLNRKDQSDFATAFMAEKTQSLTPEFVDYKKEIQSVPLRSGITLDYVKNKLNETFSLYYILEMGKNNDRLLPIAIAYLPYLGTDKYTPEQLQAEFFKLGLHFDVSCNDERAYVMLSGLEESFDQGVELFEHVLKNVKGDDKALQNLVADILSKRANEKKNKASILRNAMASYARYGKLSPFTDILSTKELKALTPDELVNQIKDLTTYEHRVFFYGAKPTKDVAITLMAKHQVPPQLKPVKMPRQYVELETRDNKVVFVDFPMVQAEVLMLSKGTTGFNLEENIMSEMYNNYFGGGLSSIVFQEIRESKALAYSASAFYTSPARKEKSHYLQAYVGTQADKLKDAINTMRDIIDNMPVSPEQIENARQSVLKRIESERINRANTYWTYRSNLDRGIDRDIRQDLYEKMKTVTKEELVKFQQSNVKGRHYTFLVLGSRNSVDMEFLRSIGAVEELSLTDVFGY